MARASQHKLVRERRMNARFRNKDDPHRVREHAERSGLGIGAHTGAVLKNYQYADGSIAVLKALVPYKGGLERIGRQALDERLWFARRD